MQLIRFILQEKRAKGDRFAVITLQFVDADGNVGDIPELLKTYVWKKPSTPLEAMREIARALPLEPSTIDWREGIEEMNQEPVVFKWKYKMDEISLETAPAASGDALNEVRYPVVTSV